ncbi:hypothetical protein ACQU0X_29290 [Pseudovibrio ascidiaceicola]|uniref:hypothetical protein n=1 Tax=Pseudovibrio ascidiaceicola TaxID=285279 RepID=UPI003D35B111
MLEEELITLHAEANTASLSAFERVLQHLSRLAQEEEYWASKRRDAAIAVAAADPMELIQVRGQQATLEIEISKTNKQISETRTELQQLPEPRWWWIFTSKHEETASRQETLTSRLNQYAKQRERLEKSLQKTSEDLCCIEKDIQQKVEDTRQEVTRRRCIARERLPIINAALQCLHDDPSHASAGPSFLLQTGRQQLELVQDIQASLRSEVDDYSLEQVPFRER